LAALSKAAAAYNLNVAGAANAYASIAARRLERDEEATQFLKQAEQLHQRLADGNPTRLSQYWHQDALFELALREAKGISTIPK